jgi:hypothetical protein
MPLAVPLFLGCISSNWPRRLSIDPSVILTLAGTDQSPRTTRSMIRRIRLVSSSSSVVVVTFVVMPLSRCTEPPLAGVVADREKGLQPTIIVYSRQPVDQRSAGWPYPATFSDSDRRKSDDDDDDDGDDDDDASIPPHCDIFPPVVLLLLLDDDDDDAAGTGTGRADDRDSQTSGARHVGVPQNVPRDSHQSSSSLIWTAKPKSPNFN